MKGMKTGGRLKGSMNKATIARLQAEGAASTDVDTNVGAAGGGGRRPAAFGAASQARARAKRPHRPGPEAGLRIRYEDLDDLHEYENNSNQHPADQITLIERLLVEYGWTTPMGKAKGMLIYGHARRQAARNLRDRGVAIPNNPDPDKGPVVDLSHLTRAQRRAYVIADNESARRSKTDREVLRLELGELGDLGFDLTLTGFDQEDLDTMLGDPEPPAPPPLRETVKFVTCPNCEHKFNP
jgi:hypothetical protein